MLPPGILESGELFDVAAVSLHLVEIPRRRRVSAEEAHEIGGSLISLNSHNFKGKMELALYSFLFIDDRVPAINVRERV